MRKGERGDTGTHWDPPGGDGDTDTGTGARGNPGESMRRRKREAAPGGAPGIGPRDRADARRGWQIPGPAPHTAPSPRRGARGGPRGSPGTGRGSGGLGSRPVTTDCGVWGASSPPTPCPPSPSVSSSCCGGGGVRVEGGCEPPPLPLGGSGGGPPCAHPGLYKSHWGWDCHPLSPAAVTFSADPPWLPPPSWCCWRREVAGTPLSPAGRGWQGDRDSGTEGMGTPGDSGDGSELGDRGMQEEGMAGTRGEFMG